MPGPAGDLACVQHRWANMTDRTRRDHPGPATTPITGILPVLMLAVFTISIGFGIVLPQLPALIERLQGVGNTPAQVPRATGVLTAIYMLAGGVRPMQTSLCLPKPARCQAAQS